MARQYAGSTTVSGKKMNLHVPNDAIRALRIKQGEKLLVYVEGKRLVLERPSS